MRADLALGAVALVWGATFVLVKDALADISPDLFLAWRFSIAALLLGLNAMRLPRAQRRYLPGIVAGLLLFTGYLLQTLGLRFTTPAKSGFLTGLYIVFVPLATAAVYRRPPKWIECVGVAIAAVGMALLSIDLSNLSISYGDVLTIGCAVAFTAHILLLGHYAKQQNAAWLAFLQIVTCAVAGWITTPLVETPHIVWSTAVLVAIGVTSVFATAVAFLVQTWGQSHTTPTRAALIFALEPVFAWLTSFLVTGEVFTKAAALGAALILLGILLVELKSSVTS